MIITGDFMDQDGVVLVISGEPIDDPISFGGREVDFKHGQGMRANPSIDLFTDKNRKPGERGQSEVSQARSRGGIRQFKIDVGIKVPAETGGKTGLQRKDFGVQHARIIAL